VIPAARGEGRDAVSSARVVIAGSPAFAGSDGT
jgi:hypothetical protein